MAAWPSGHHTGKAAPRHWVNPTKTLQHDHPTKDYQNCQMPRKGISVLFVKKCHINSPTRKSKWWATVSPYWTRGQKTSSLKPNGVWWTQTASLLWCTDSKHASTNKRYSHHQSKELTPCDLLQKSTSHQEQWNGVCMIQKREVEQIFTCYFPAPLSVPYHIQMITTISIDLMNFLKYFSLHFVFHSLMTAVEFSSYATWRGEELIQGSRNKHWCPYSFDANQVC